MSTTICETFISSALAVSNVLTRSTRDLARALVAVPSHIRVLMPVNTVRLLPPTREIPVCDGVDTAPNVLLERHRLQVIWIATSMNPTQMIDRETRWNRTNEQRVDQPMREPIIALNIDRPVVPIGA